MVNLTFLRNFDLFGTQPTFLLGERFKYRSQFSGFVSLIIIIWAISITTIQLVSFIKRDSVSIIENNYRVSFPQRGDFANSGQYFALKLDSKQELGQYYELKAYQKQKTVIQTNILKYFIDQNPIEKETELKLVNCSMDTHFQKYSQYPQVRYDLLSANIDEWKCVDVSSSLKVGGSFGKGVFEYLSFEIQFCFDRSSNCISESVFRDQVIQMTTLNLTLSFLFINFQINPIMAQDYAVPYVDRSTYFQINPYQQVLQANVYIREIQIQSVQNLLMFDLTTNESYLYNDFLEKEIILQANNVARLSGRIMKINFRKSYFFTKTQRNYKMISDIMSYVGGFMNSVSLIFATLLTFYNHQSYLKYIANSCYRFVDKQTFQEFQEQGECLNLSGREKNSQSVQEMRKIFHANSLARISNHRLKMRHFCSRIFRCKIKDPGNQIILRATLDLISRELDVIKYIKMIHDFQKLKSIVLTKQQQRVFDELPDPLILLSSKCSNVIEKIEPPIFQDMIHQTHKKSLVGSAIRFKQDANRKLRLINAIRELDQQKDKDFFNKLHLLLDSTSNWFNQYLNNDEKNLELNDENQFIYEVQLTQQSDDKRSILLHFGLQSHRYFEDESVRYSWQPSIKDQRIKGVLKLKNLSQIYIKNFQLSIDEDQATIIGEQKHFKLGPNQTVHVNIILPILQTPSIPLEGLHNKYLIQPSDLSHYFDDLKKCIRKINIEWQQDGQNTQNYQFLLSILRFQFLCIQPFESDTSLQIQYLFKKTSKSFCFDKLKFLHKDLEFNLTYRVVSVTRCPVRDQGRQIFLSFDHVDGVMIIKSNSTNNFVRAYILLHFALLEYIEI